MYSRTMNKRFVVRAAILGLASLALSGCEVLFPKRPYFGVKHGGKKYVPTELHETREVVDE